MKKVSILPLILAIPLAGCAQTKNFFPENKVGTTQEYSIEVQSPFSGNQTGKVTTRLVGEETINNKKYYRIVTAFSGMPGLDQQVGYERWAADGVYAIDGQHKATPEYLDFPQPVGIGKKWISNDPDGKKEEEAVSLETVLIGDKTYDGCLKVSYKQQTPNGIMEGTEYYAPGVGLVKSVAHGGGTNITMTLQKAR